ncbi:MAG TPA: alpha-L-fucosidase [Candidatus Bacteroides avicola]|uniref:alpha-L-fucosidase n=1 Tax=Candidatus Bacteroides avicola TaxID=2838468 RepID=A0A9D2HWQ8_9BACE|nr:alpha-L-fucosidase [Candidatus Bacteroides avicola]
MNSFVRNTICAILCAGGSLLLPTHAQEIVPATQPNATQRAMTERGYGMFIHFGVNTFTNDEWSDGKIPVSAYHPTRLDPEQWVRVARDAGFRYVLLVTKHHDGFCLWDSRYTDYDVASSPVKTDVVKAVSEACRKYGLKFAIYYSLWDRHEPIYTDKDPSKYIDYMCNQLRELLTNYGEVCELWLDGGWDRAVKDWELPRVYKLVKSLQPLCAMGVNHTIETKPGSRQFALPDLMTEDNKYTFQYFPSDFRLWDPKIAHARDHKQYLHDGKSYYVPFEHTVCLSKIWTWFQKDHPAPVRDLDELEELFYRCTANGNTLVVNVPPDRTGRIRPNEAEAVISLGKRLGLEKGKPLPTGGSCISMEQKAEATSVWNENNGEFDAARAVDGGMQTRWAAADTLATLTVCLDPQQEFNRICIFEYCDTKNGDDGFTNYRTNRIRSYVVETLEQGEWLPIYVGDEPMGDCKVIRLAQKRKAEKIRLRVTAATAPPSIWEFNVINR